MGMRVNWSLERYSAQAVWLLSQVEASRAKWQALGEKLDIDTCINWKEGGSKTLHTNGLIEEMYILSMEFTINAPFTSNWWKKRQKFWLKWSDL